MWLIDPMHCRARRDQASKPLRRHLAEQRFFSYSRRVRRYLQSKWRRAAQRLRAQSAPTWMEQLEPRTLLSTITVDSLADNTTDDGLTTLREAIIMSEASAGADVIEFDAALEGEIYLDEILPTISEELDINGDDRITIDGQGNDQLLSLTTGADLTLDELVLTNGYADGAGGIVSYGDGVALTIKNSTIENNSATAFGGAISLTNGGELTIENSTFTNNSTESSSGGAIFARNATIDITDSAFENNEAGTDGGSFHGGAIYNAGSTITITDSLFEDNIADFAGGAIYNTNQTGDPDTIGNITIINSTIAENKTNTSSGGGIYNAGTLTITNSTISGNEANVGAGIINETSGNNTATADINNSTIAFNFSRVATASAGSGIRNNGGQVTLTSTIVANNTDDNDDASDIANLSGGTTTGSFNLIGDAATAGGLTDGTNGNIVGEDPQLFPLRDYGGPNFTHAIGPDSPAIDQGDANGATTDQRGALRTFDVTTVPDQQTSPADPTDIGAYEYQNGDPDLVPPLIDAFITGVVFRDANGDGVRDPGDQGLGDILVDLYDENDSQFTSTFTDPDGSFRFEVEPGDYTVRVNEQYLPGLIASTNVNERSVSHDDGISQVDPLGFSLLGGTIGGIKFDDTDADGRWDIGERTIADVTFFLDLNFNNVFDEGEPTATTDGSGRYEFQNVPFTTAVVRELPQEGQTQTSPTAATFLHGDFTTRPDDSLLDIIVDDFNGDGLLDIVLLSYSQLVLRLQNEDGSLGLPSTILDTSEFSSLDDADLLPGFYDDNASRDLLLPTESGWIVLLNNGVGFFTQHDLGDPQFDNIDAVDLNGDGLDDLLSFDDQTHRFVQFENLGGPGAGGFDTSSFVSPAIDGIMLETEIGDLNDDGDLDVAVLFDSVTTGQVHLIALLNDGTGQLIAGPETQLAHYANDTDFIIGDVNGDGNGDIVLLQNNVNVGDDTLSILTTYSLQDASNFASPIESITPYIVNGIDLFDANGDGNLDALIDGNAVFALFGDGSGAFGGFNPTFLSDPIPADPFYFGDHNYFAVAAGDFNNDGFDDAFGLHQDFYGFPNQYTLDLFANVTGGHRLELIDSQSIIPPGDLNFGNIPEGNLITGHKFFDENGNGIDDILIFTNLRSDNNIARNDFFNGGALANLIDTDSPLFPTLPGPIAPAGIAISPDDHNVYIADNNTGSVYVFTPNGQFVRTFVDGSSLDAPIEPGAIEFSPDGTLFVVSQSGDILRFDGRTGEAIGQFNFGDDANFYSDLEFSANGNLFAADAGATQIVEFASDGQILRVLESNDLNFPQGIAIDGDRLIATDMTDDGSGIVIFDLVTGAPSDEITIFFSEFDAPELMDIDLGPDGFYYVVDQTFDGIRRINATTLQVDDEYFAPLSRNEVGDDTFVFAPSHLAIRSEPGLDDVIIYSDANNDGRLEFASHEFDTQPDLDIGTGMTKTSDIEVSGLAGETVNFLEVEIQLASDETADLEVTLIAPTGDRVLLIRDSDFSGGFFDTIFADDGHQTLFQAEQNDQSSSGLFIPRQSLSSLNGIDPNGTWSLEITNNGTSVANLEEWFIEISVGEQLTHTDVNGNYRLAGLPDGEHNIREVTPINTIQTSSDENPLVHTVNLADNETFLQDINFANAPHGEIFGFYFRDVDNNGEYNDQANDFPLENIIVFLDANDNGTLDQETFDVIDFTPGSPDTIPTYDEGDYTGTVTGATETVSGISLDLILAEAFSPNEVFISLYSPSGADLEIELTGDAEIHFDTGAFNGQDANGEWRLEIENEADGSIEVVSVNLTIATGEQSAETIGGENGGTYRLSNVRPGAHIVRSAEPGVDITFPTSVFFDGFESESLAPWNTLGDVRLANDNTAPPANGDFHTLLTNGLGAVDIASIETFAGLTSGALDSLGGTENPFEGSVIQRTIRAEIGDVLSFDFNFLTNETEVGDIANDFAFASISDGSAPMLLADAADATTTSTTAFDAETGYDTFQHTFTSAGLFTITIGVVDVDDNAVDSALLIDDFAVTGTGMESLHVVNIEPGEVIENIDFGSLASNAIGNRVWHDVNADGIRQIQEAGIDNVTINLYLVDQGASLVDTTTTSNGGFYSFENFADGDYFIEVVLPDGFDLFTTQHAGDIGDDDNSNIDTETGFSDTIKFAGGETRDDIDVGLLQFGVITGAVFNDANGDGTRDGESGLNGWTVELVDEGTQQVVATQSSATITGVAPTDSLIVGSDSGQVIEVLGFDPSGSALDLNLSPDAGFSGGVRVATGDVNGDGLADIITSPGAGTAPTVRIFSGADQSLLAEFFAFDEAFTGGVYVAAGDVNGDGFADIIAGAGAGGSPTVRVFDGTDPTQLLANFFAYDQAFTGGVRVAAGDINGDGNADIITGAGPGDTPQVRVFDVDNTTTPLVEFFAYDQGFSGGVYVASGDVNGDGTDDIITGGNPDGDSHVKVFDGSSVTQELANFFAFDPSFTGGVRVAAGDVNGDGQVDIITGAGPGDTPLVRAFDAGNTTTPISEFFAYDESFTGGVFVTGVAPQAEDSDGRYFFNNVAPGSYTVRQVVETDWTQTTPDDNGAHDVQLDSGATIGGLDFGNFNIPTGDAIFELPESGAFEVFLENDNLILQEQGNPANRFIDAPLSGLTSLTINGTAGADTLVIVMSGGNPLPTTFTFNGGDPTTGTGDSLELRGGTADTVAHTISAIDSGGINVVDGSTATTITYTGLEPVIDTIVAANRTFSFTGADETITVSAGSETGLMLIDSTLGESIEFANPTGTLTIDVTAGTGADTINVQGVGEDLTADLAIVGDADDEIIFDTTATTIDGGDLTLSVGTVAIASLDLGSLAIGEDEATIDLGEGSLVLNTSGESTIEGDISSGNVTINGGSLTVNGNINTAGNINVINAPITGNGEFTGTVQFAGTLAPGDAPRIFTANTFNFLAGSAFDVAVAGLGTGQQDQLKVIGGVSIASGTTLTLESFQGFSPEVPGEFTIIDNQSGSAVNGEFDGFAEGEIFDSSFLDSNFTASISYTGGDGNDVVIIVAPVDGIISGTKYRDDNANGALDSGEPGLAGVRIYVDLNDNGAFDEGDEPSDITDQDGDWEIPNLPTGEYTIREVVGEGFQQTGTISHDITITSGDVINDLDFFNVSTTQSLAGTKYLDLDGDGAQDPGDSPIEGVTVFLDINDNGEFDEGDEPSDVTDESGDWLIDSILPGNYTVRELVPGGFTQTGAPASVQVDAFDNIEDLDFFNAPIGTTAVRLDQSGNLLIQDIGTVTDDTLTIKSDTANNQFIITDATNLLFTDIDGATGNGTNTITVAFASVTGASVIVDTLGGDDTLTVDFTLGDMARDIQFNGGSQSAGDALELIGGAFNQVDFIFTNANDGSVDLDESTTITYTGLEPITSSMDISNLSLIYNGGSETINITDAGRTSETTVTSTAGESVTFINPTQSLFINAGSGDDTINVNGLGNGFAADLGISGDVGSADVINWNAADTVNNLLLEAEAIHLNADVTASGNQTYTGVVILDTDATITAAEITFDNTVDSATGETNALTISGDTEFKGIVGGADLLASLSINATGGDVFFREAVNVGTGGLAVDPAEFIQIDGDITSLGAVSLEAVGSELESTILVNSSITATQVTLTSSNLQGDGNITTTAGDLTIDGGGELGGAIVTAGTLVKQSSDTFDLSGSATSATVAAGRLDVTGNITGAVTVDTIAILGGDGSIAGAVNNSGSLAPGQSPGTLATGDFTFADNSSFDVEFDLPDYDQLDVTGSVAIGNNVALNVEAFNDFTPAVGDTFTIIDNDGGDAVVGTFASLAEGAEITNFLGSALTAFITYTGGDGNDVVITVLPLATISGRVWHDENADGLFVDESVISEHTVELVFDSNVIDTVTTDGSGNYTFLLSEAGTYFVQVSPGSFDENSPLPDSPDAPIDTDINPNTQRSEAITITGGEDIENIDAGLFDFASVDGFKFLDFSNDGIQQTGETGIGGFTFYVDYNDNGTFDEGDEPSAVSSDGLDEQQVGEFTIFGITPGTYKVREVPRAGFEQTAPIELFYTIDVSSGDTFGSELVFGNFSLATDIILTGFKYVDTNANGAFDDGESPLGGVRIFVDLDNNGAYDDGEPFALTDEQTGQFTIEQVPSGSWQVREEFDAQDIANYLPTTPLQYVGTGNLTIEQVLDQGDDAADVRREVDGLLGAFDVTVSPDGRFIYTAGKDPFGVTYDPELALSGAIGIFSRNPVDGSIESIGSFTQNDAERLASVSGLAVSPDGNYLYAVADVGEAILVFERDQVSGQLTLIQTRHDGDASGTTGLSGARRVTVSADGKSIYVVSVADNQLTHFRRNTNGTLSVANTRSLGNLVGATVLGQDVAVSSDGRSVYVVGTEDQGNDFIIAFSRNTTTGSLTHEQTITNDQLGGAAGLGGAVDVEIARDGRQVFVAGRLDNAVAVFERDATDSTLTLVQTVTATIDGPSSIAASNDGTQVFVANFTSDSISVFDRNPLTGRLDAHSQTASGDLDGAFALALDPIGNDLFAVGFVSDTLVSLSRDISGFIPGGFEFSATINETLDGFNFGNFTGGDLVASINDETFTPPATVAPGAAFNLPFDITNAGPAAANGTVDVNIYASTDDSLDAADILIHRLTDIDINLLPDQILSLNPQVNMTGEMLNNDTYRFIVDVNPSHTLPEMDFTNNTDVSADAVDVNLAIAGLGNAMQLVNAFGDVFRVALSGTTAGATSAITLTAALNTDSFGNPIYDLTIGGGNAQSQVVITNLSGNDRRLDLGDVIITGQFANFTAAKTNLFGDFSADNIRNITMGDWDADHIVRINNNNGGQLVNIDIDRWVDVDFESAAAIGSFNATFMYDSSDDDRFFAPSVNSLFIEGGEDQAGESNVYFDIAGHLGSAVVNGAVTSEWNLGSAGNIIAGNVTDFALYVVNNLASLTLADVTDSRVDIGGDTGTIFGQSVTNSNIIANSVNSIEIIGDWINTENVNDETSEIGPIDDETDLELAQLLASQTNGVGKSAGAIVVGGVTNGITIRAEGNINTLHFGRLRDSTVFAGVRNDFDRTMTNDGSYLPDSTSNFARQATIGQFTVTGLSGSVDGDGIHQSFVDSIIASWNIGNAAIREVNSSHYYTGDKQGIAGVNIGRFERFMGSLGRVTIYGGEGDLPDKYGNFHLRVIEPDL